MQSPKGIVENVLVKIDIFIFLVDFVILDIVEDDKVPIILGRPMLSTAHARIDVFSRKFSPEVGNEKVIFTANEGVTPLAVSSVCVVNDFQVPDNFGRPEDLKEFLMNEDINGDLGNFLIDNNLLPGIDMDSFGTLSDSETKMGIGLDDLGEGIEYKRDEEVIDWNNRGHASVHETTILQQRDGSLQSSWLINMLKIVVADNYGVVIVTMA
ncbi:putative reverse transcriptase domain-containing protein [Tanacetum coccineum]|uniref:Reverse transcriptase domain-containing protein n=1 Tax=Tanacetum coccineum TaxID=301880 RepID=A0ABQ5HE92_9ASTR